VQRRQGGEGGLGGWERKVCSLTLVGMDWVETEEAREGGRVGGCGDRVAGVFLSHGMRVGFEVIRGCGG
jgi:hypothetical protein